MRGCFIVMAFLFGAMAYGQSIFDVARSGDISAFNKLVGQNPDAINSQNASGHTPLILAAYNNQLEIAKLLIENGADVNFSFSQGSAIHGAAYKGYLEIVKLLAANGAKLDEPDGNGSTPLIYATLFGHTEVAKFLYEKGADPNQKDGTGNSAKSYAQSLNNQELITIFNN